MELLDFELLQLSMPAYWILFEKFIIVNEPPEGHMDKMMTTQIFQYKNVYFLYYFIVYYPLFKM